MNLQQPVRWHALSAQEALQRLGAHVEGLSDADAAARLERFGPNTLPEPRRATIPAIVLRQLANPFIYVLCVAALASLALQEWSDAGFILAVILIDATVGAIQEWRAETSAASLRKTLRISPTIVRGGVRRQIDIAELVPGDIVLLESGAAVPADLRLLSTHDLKSDESLLTGESAPVDKQADAPAAIDAGIGDRMTMAHAGAMMVSGRGVGVVCATGADTELGTIAGMLTGPSARPPLLVRMDAFSRRIGGAAIALVLAIGLGQWAHGVPLGQIFVFTIALAVSAIPEGLPVAVTVALAAASARMARRGVIVRRLPAVEALGSCTLIATDKTGTLTVNRLTAKQLVIAGGARFEAEGEGLELEGALRRLDRDGAPGDDGLQKMARAGALTNEASIDHADGAVEAQGDAVDIAFLVLGEKLGIHRNELVKAYELVASLPYESRRGYSAALHREGARAILSVKGAPELVLPMCKGVDAAWAEAQVHRLAQAGYRVLALAEGELAAETAELSAEDLRGLTLLGFAGLIDPLRSEAPQAVAEARAAGVDVRMITGDHPETALAIARQLDPAWSPDKALTGAELASLKGAARAEAVREAAVFARVEPAQKHLIVTELQRQGHFVAVTGDGVNDAPALRAAHVGVAMGAGGTDVARAAASLIITDDDFASIVAGVEEGRAAYDNIRKIVWLLISTGIAEILMFTLALLSGGPMPLIAVQILWLNLVHEGAQDVALGLEKKEPDVMRKPPRRPQEPVFDRRMIEQCLVIGVYCGVLAFALFAWLQSAQGYDEVAARNLTLLFLVSYSNFHVLNCRSETRSIFAIPLRANPLLIASVVAAQALHVGAMHIPLFQHLLGLQPVSFGEWSGVLTLAASVLVVGEAYKALRSRPMSRAYRAPLDPPPQK